MGSKSPHHRVQMLGWPVSEGSGAGCPGEASTMGLQGSGGLSMWGVRDREVLGREQVAEPYDFHSLLPPFSVSILPPLPCFAPHSCGSGPQGSL